MNNNNNNNNNNKNMLLMRFRQYNFFRVLFIPGSSEQDNHRFAFHTLMNASMSLLDV